VALNFPDNPIIDQIYSDATSGFYFKWDGIAWQSFTPGSSSNIRILDDISSEFTGIAKTFTISSGGIPIIPLNTSQLVINLGGIVQDASDDYAITGSSIIFSEPPETGLSFSGISLGPAVPISNINAGIVTPDKLSAGAPWWLSDYKVGIGTSVPTSLLDVEGNAIITGIVTANTFSGQLSAGISTISNLRVTGITTLGVTTTTSLSAEMISIAGASSTIANLIGTVLNYQNITATNESITGISTIAQLVGTSVTSTRLVSTHLRVTGITTLGSSNGIGTVTIGTGITALLVDGNARITGILSIGQGTITIDGNTNTISGISSVTDASGSYLTIPPGTVISVASSIAPAGYLKANGAMISRSTYSALFACIGTAFGAGAGGTTFSIPDLRDRFIVGSDSSYSLGNTGGVNNVTLTTAQIPSHTHPVSFNFTSVVTQPGGNETPGGGGRGQYANISATATSAGGDGSHENRPPYVALLRCIKY
jgi:microcystin-dependent protein